MTSERVNWKLVPDAPVRSDKYGKIQAETALTRSGLRVYRRRRVNNRHRFMFWSEKDLAPKSRLSDVVAFAREKRDA